MSRFFTATVGGAEVVRRDDAPAAFRWRDRPYRVATVLAHWVEAGEWWLGRSDGGRTGQPGDGAAHALDDREREFWRVEAHPAGAPTGAPGDTVTGVYDLRFDWSTGTWSVIRVHD